MNPPNGKEFCRTLEQHGWVHRRTEGSHHIYGKAGSAVRLSIPIHANRPLKLGLLRFLAKLAEIPDEEFGLRPLRPPLGACLSNRRILLAKEGRVRFCLWHEQDISPVENR